MTTTQLLAARWLATHGEPRAIHATTEEGYVRKSSVPDVPTLIAWVFAEFRVPCPASVAERVRGVLLALENK